MDSFKFRADGDGCQRVWPRLLQKHVHGGKVDYAALKKKDFPTLEWLYRRFLYLHVTIR